MPSDRYTPGWVLGVYPSEADVRDAIEAGELWLGLADVDVVAAMVLVSADDPKYADVAWPSGAGGSDVACIHLLAVRPSARGTGAGDDMVKAAIDLSRSWCKRANPCDRVKAPKRRDSERESLSSAEACRLLECIDKAEEEAYAAEDAKEARQTEQKKFNRGYIVGITDIACAVAARLGLATGARRGEALAVKRGAVNVKEGYVDILESISPSMKVTKPKNRKTRRVYLDAKTVKSLSRWMDYQVSELAKIKKKVDDNVPVFSDAKGGYLNPSNFSRWWRSFTDLNGFHGLCFHELRHTQATQLLANGVDVKTVQTRLGHAKASITLDMYTRAVPQNDQAAADLVGKLFASNAGEDELKEPKRLSA